jgi:hypothetical protein
LDLTLGALKDYTSLPLGFVTLRISDQRASALGILNYVGPTATDEHLTLKIFEYKSKDLKPDEVLEFYLVDTISLKQIAFVRYYQELNQFVIRCEDSPYRVIPYDLSNMRISKISVVNRTNAFELTDTTQWLNREGSTFRQGLSQAYEEKHKTLLEVRREKSVTSNASLALGLAGGVASGIGGAIEGHNARKHEKEMQANTFGQQDKLQNNQFTQDQLMQGNMFGFQTEMQANSQLFQDMMQNNRFDQETGMQTRQFQQQGFMQGNQFKQENFLQGNQFKQDKDMLRASSVENRRTLDRQSQNRLTERGLGANSRFFGGDAF